MTFSFKLKNEITGKTIAYKIIGCYRGYNLSKCGHNTSAMQYTCVSDNYIVGVKQPKNAGEINIDWKCFKVPNQFNYYFTITR